MNRINLYIGIHVYSYIHIRKASVQCVVHESMNDRQASVALNALPFRTWLMKLAYSYSGHNNYIIIIELLY